MIFELWLPGHNYSILNICSEFIYNTAVPIPQPNTYIYFKYTHTHTFIHIYFGKVKMSRTHSRACTCERITRCLSAEVPAMKYYALHPPQRETQSKRQSEQFETDACAGAVCVCAILRFIHRCSASAYILNEYLVKP